MFEFGFFVMNGFCSASVGVNGVAVAGEPTNDGAFVAGPGAMGPADADAAGIAAAHARSAAGRTSRDRGMRRPYNVCLRIVKLTFHQQPLTLPRMAGTKKTSGGTAKRAALRAKGAASR